MGHSLLSLESIRDLCLNEFDRTIVASAEPFALVGEIELIPLKLDAWHVSWQQTCNRWRSSCRPLSKVALSSDKVRDTPPTMDGCPKHNRASQPQTCTQRARVWRSPSGDARTISR